MVEQSINKSNFCGQLISQVERLAWEQFEKKFKSKGRLRYSCDNRCKDKIRVLARLDTLFAPKGMGAQ
jgi:hypothetical protein